MVGEAQDGKTARDRMTGEELQGALFICRCNDGDAPRLPAAIHRYQVLTMSNRMFSNRSPILVQL